MKWIYLLIAGILEITWAVAMKMSDGFTVLVPSIITVGGYIKTFKPRIIILESVYVSCYNPR